jgi:succinate-acetate transporter protein
MRAVQEATPANEPAQEYNFWRDRSRVVLQPVAAPSILGLFGFMGATLIVAGNMAGWYGSPTTSPLYLFEFAAFFGGLAQFLAGMWCFRARDALGTAMHGTWGSFWMAYGLLNLLAATKTITLPTGAFPELGWWFIVLAAITGMGAIASLAESLSLFSVLGLLAAGSAFAAAAFVGGSIGLQHAAGYIFVASAAAAWYTASAMMLENTFGRVILPLGKLKKAANMPGSSVTTPIQFAHGMPGVKKGQ